MPDEVIAHYRLIRPLGAGGMGEVHLAKDTRLERKVALKLLPEAFATHAQRRQRFLTEAKAASALNHPNVCIVYEVGETEDHRPFIAMEYIQGMMLEDRARHQALTPPEIAAVGIQVADALEAAHAQGIVHRDIKPSNISVNERGIVKVLDFGLAKRLLALDEGEDPDAPTQLATRTGEMLGTPSYMSPEQVLGREVDGRSDLFALGIVLYELSAGQLPFAGNNLGEIIDHIVHRQPEPLARLNYEVPQELERIIRKCLEKDPERRFQSARELRVDLRSLLRQLEEGADTAWVLAQSDRIQIEELPSPKPASVQTRPAVTITPETIRRSDLVMIFAQPDDQTLDRSVSGWVTELKRNLDIRLEQLAVEKTTIALVPLPKGEQAIDEPLGQALTQARALVPILSPPFLKSNACRAALDSFASSHANAGTKPTLFKVVKTPVANEDMPDGWSTLLGGLIGFEFYREDPATGRVLEFDKQLGDESRHHYFERVYDLAWEIYQWQKSATSAPAILPSTRPGAEPRTVYLAMTSSDLKTERDQVQRELLERGHVVLPQQNLPLEVDALNDLVRECLDKSSLAVHLLGARYGVIPEGAADSLPAIQLMRSAEQAAGLQRLIWTPADMPEADQRQAAFLEQVRHDAGLLASADLIEGPLSQLTRELVRRVDPPPEPAKREPAADSTGGPSKIYLICEPRDEGAIEPLEDFFYNKGLEVCLPAFDGSEALASDLHRENLLSCDAAFIFYGQAPRAWVDIKLRDILKAPGYGRPDPIPHQAVYIAPPHDRRKERFRSLQAEVIRQENGVAAEQLESFIQHLE